MTGPIRVDSRGRPAHPVACWCVGLATDATCPTRWIGDVGATACPRRAPHPPHPWIGRHPWGLAGAHVRMRCRGRRWRDLLRRTR